MIDVLLDTGVIVGWLDRSDRHHAACVRALDGLSARLLTCEAVITEACYLLRAVPGAPEAILANVEQGTFDLSFRLAEHAHATAALLTRYRDAPMDLADACLVRMADVFDTGRILTLDGNFHAYRWRRRRAFHFLVDV